MNALHWMDKYLDFTEITNFTIFPRTPQRICGFLHHWWVGCPDVDVDGCCVFQPALGCCRFPVSNFLDDFRCSLVISQLKTRKKNLKKHCLKLVNTWMLVVILRGYLIFVLACLLIPGWLRTFKSYTFCYHLLLFQW